MKNFNRSIAILAATAAVLALTACGTTRAPDPQEVSAKLVEKSAPDWFTNPQSNASAYQAVGDGVSASMSGAVSNARTAAFEGICQSAGAVVRSQSKQFRMDTERSSGQVNTTATRNFCPDVDVSGAVVEKQHIVRDGSRFRAFVLVSLNKGVNAAKGIKSVADAEFKDLDRVNDEYQKNKKQ